MTIELPFICGPFRAHGHVFSVASDNLLLAQFVDEVFVDLRTDDARPCSYEIRQMPDGQLRVLFEGENVGTGGPAPDVLACLMWHVNAHATRSAATDHVVLHASSASLDGIAVVLAGPMESGKTTTVAALLHAGYSYLTDEAVAVEPDSLLLRAYPKPLSIDPGSQELFADLAPEHPARRSGQWLVPASVAGAAGLSDRVPAGVVIAVRHGGKACRTSLEPISRGEMLVELAESTFHFADAPRRNLDVTAALLRRCDTYRLTTGNLGDTVGEITSAIERKRAALTQEASA